jgi:hypothetical protein
MPSRQDRVSLIRRISDPLHSNLTEAITTAKAALESGKLIEIELLEFLEEEAEQSRMGERASRLLEIVSELGLASNLLSIKTPLLAHPDPRVRSKSVLLIGRELKSADWVMRRMVDSDQRVRANAIESAWGVQSSEMQRVFERATRSANNRVAANGLVGLYLQNDISSISRLFEMAEHPDLLFRRSARWAMGETRDARFLPFLRDDYKQGGQDCRSVLFRALTRIQKQVKCSQEVRRFQLRTSGWQADPGGKGSFYLSVSQADGETPPLFAKTNFVFLHGSRLILNYDVTPQANPSLMVAGFVIPREPSPDCGYRRAIENSLNTTVQTKRNGDLWWIHRYCVTETAPQSALCPPTEDRVLTAHRHANQNFLSEETFIRKFIPGPGRRDEASSDLASGIRKMIAMVARVAGTRNVFVFFHPDSPLPDSPREERALNQIAEDLAESQCKLYGIMPSSDPHQIAGARRLCESSGGEFHHVDVDRVETLIPDIYHKLLNRYSVKYESATTDNKVPDVQIFSPQGFAELLHSEIVQGHRQPDQPETNPS